MFINESKAQTWEFYLLLVPRIEALASPYQLNEQRRSPRRYVSYIMSLYSPDVF